MRITPVCAPERRAIIFGMGAVGRADLDQPRARPRHDVRHAERAADLDQFAARDDSLAAVRQRVEAEQHGRRIIVHERRVFRAGQGAEQRPHMVVALAALARRQVELQRHGSRMAATAASIAASASTARPRLVCSTVPVRLNSGRRPERSSASKPGERLER